ncbi:MAG: glycosyltransferase 87 family protein [Vicinamibacterales bacterium]
MRHDLLDALAARPALHRAGLALLCAAAVVLAWQATTRSVDFPVYYRAAADVLAGRYDVYPASMPDGSVPPHGFRYAPAIALLMAPLALVPLEAGAFALFLAKLAALAYMSKVVARWCGRSDDWKRMGVLGFLVCAGYAAEEMRYGNIQLLCVAALVMAFDGAMRRRVVVPAGALALAVAAKLAPLILWPLLLWRRAWGAALACLVALGMLAVAPAAIVGHAANVRLLARFTAYAREKVDEQDNFAWRGVVDRAFDAAGGLQEPASPRPVPLPATLLWLAGSACLMVATWAALRTPAQDGRVLMLELSLVLTLMLLVSPHTQRRYFVTLFVPSVTLLAISAGECSLPERTRTWIRRGQLGILLPGTVLPALFAGHVLSRLYQFLSVYFFGALVLFIALVVTIRDLKRQWPSTSSAPESAASAHNVGPTSRARPTTA